MSKKLKSILITFDYELFLGEKSGSVENCLLKPTYKILDVLHKNEAQAIFFIDLTYLSQLKKIKNLHKLAEIDYQKIIQQLLYIKERGHYLYFHIHPHWLDAIYLPKINQWDLSNNKHFTLNNLNDKQIESVFFESYKILTNDLMVEVSQEKPSGFRAGGLYIQPFDKIKPFFKKYNIKYDFSVFKNAKSISNNNLYGFDFTNSPKDLIYKFNSNVLEPSKKGLFIEIPMEPFEIKNGGKIINGIMYRLTKDKETNKPFGDGVSSNNLINIKKRTLSNYLKAEETISIELLNSVRTILYQNYLKKNNFLHFISHPKFFSENNINQFDVFLKKTKSKYQVETNFKKILQSILSKN